MLASFNQLNQPLTKGGHKLKKQYLLWLLALSFFTRIPVKLTSEINEEMLHQASRYFALVGTLIGCLLAAVFYFTQLFLPLSIAIIITLAVNLLLTGAFHEDGWADVWDGFGGGWEVKQKLAIMKDSRLGTYGAAALFIVLFLKYQSLLVLTANIELFLVVLILANTLSRTLATSLIFSMPYVSEDAFSKVKPVVKNLSKNSLIILIATSFITLFLGVVISALTLLQACYLLLVLWLTRALLIKWFNKQLSGYTGDCLGAAQVASEIIIYLTVIVFGIHPHG